VFFEGVFFEEVVTDAFVCGEQDPAFRAYEREPGLIEDSAIEVCEMALEAYAELG
jgi:hypothetical protein